MAWGCSFPLYHVRVCGRGCAKVPLRLHISLLIFIAVAIGTEVAHLQIQELLVMLAYCTLGICVSALLVAMGQLSAASCCGCAPKTIIIWPIGTIAHYEQPPSRHCHRIFIALTGVLVHLAMLIAWYGVILIFGCRISMSTPGGSFRQIW